MNLYYTDSHGPDQAALIRGFSYALQLTNYSNLDYIHFGCHTKINFKANTFEYVFGKDFMKKLISGSVIYNSITIHMFTERINLPSYTDSIIFVPHISMDFLLKIISVNPNSSIVLIPWAKSELDFLKGHFPTAIQI